MQRPQPLADFLACLAASLKAAAEPGSPTALAVDRAFDRLATPGTAATPRPDRAPATQWLAPALAAAERGAVAPDRGAAANLASAFAAIAPGLAWQARTDRRSSDPNFPNAHANAVIVGAGGLEERSDVRIGASLLAPHTEYPDHSHPPEEVYIALSSGMWRQNDGPWQAPGPGGLIYNPPNIVHAMLSDAAPLLAIWTLPMSAPSTMPTGQAHG